MKNCIDHLGIIVRNLERILPLYTDILGLEVTRTEIVEGEKVKVALLPAGGMRIELIEPQSADSPAGRYLERHGEGLHHICLRVPDIHETCKRCREAGIRLLNEEPKDGAEGRKYVFLDPKQTGRVLIELCQIP